MKISIQDYRRDIPNHTEVTVITFVIGNGERLFSYDYHDD